ncbi:Protein CapI [Geodia barretti]|uniref:Protein CapI n=1 Tax=Geodia barretti TaxID=519541 RepID=A0AA35SV61_GEOBA|nr:Protein CapI [Geodia barretti]
MVERGEQVYATDINPLPDIRGVERDAIRSARVDITDFEQVTRSIVEAEPDRIINLAYLLGGGEGNPHHQMRLNILGMDNCFEAARLLGVNRVVYASSVAVSGQQSNFGDRLATEDDGTFGSSQYAVHKIFNEFQAKMFNENYGMSITGIRPANVTGPDKVRGSVDHVRCVTLPARGEPVSFPYQEMMRLPIHVEDIAEAFVRVSLVDRSESPVYNSGGTAISLGHLAEMVRGYLPDAQISFDDPGGREHSGNYLVDNSRLLNEFELAYAPLSQRVLEIINDVRADEGLPLITG